MSSNCRQTIVKILPSPPSHDPLMTVTILRVDRRGPGFDPSKVRIEWK